MESTSGWITGPGTAKSSFPPLLNMWMARSKIRLFVLHAHPPRKFSESNMATKSSLFVFSSRSLSYWPSSSPVLRMSSTVKKPQQIISIFFLSLSSNRQINFGNRLTLSPSEPLFSLVTQRVLFQVGKRAVAWRDQTTVVKETGIDLDWSMNSLLAAVNRNVTICSTYISEYLLI